MQALTFSPAHHGLAAHCNLPPVPRSPDPFHLGGCFTHLRGFLCRRWGFTPEARARHFGRALARLPGLRTCQQVAGPASRALPRQAAAPRPCSRAPSIAARTSRGCPWQRPKPRHPRSRGLGASAGLSGPGTTPSPAPSPLPPPSTARPLRDRRLLPCRGAAGRYQVGSKRLCGQKQREQTGNASGTDTKEK